MPAPIMGSMTHCCAMHYVSGQDTTQLAYRQICDKVLARLAHFDRLKCVFRRNKVTDAADNLLLVRRPMALFLKPLRDGAIAHRIINQRNHQVIATEVVAAFDSKTRRTGLLKHESLRDGSALVIAPTNAIHTFFMRFDIDVVFVQRDGKIVKVRHAMPPWRMAGALRGYAVVELPSGTCARTGTGVGDILLIT